MTDDDQSRPIEILLVEDNEGDALLTQITLQRAKLANVLSIVHDGEEALRLLRREGEFAGHKRPDLVLLDLNLPRLDGREVLAAIRQDPALKEIPVVILSGSQAQAEIATGQALQADGHIVKPVSFEQLRRVVSSIDTFWFTLVSLPANVRG